MLNWLRRKIDVHATSADVEIHRLLRCYQGIGLNGKRVLLDVAEGLRRGVDYGDFSNSLQDMEAEGLEELRDALIYFTVEIHRRRAHRGEG